MAEGNHFLNIPQQEGLFTTIKSGRSEDRRDCEAEDEDDEEAEENVRLIPRCSPIPRKRGSSIIDETAEYMRIRLVLARRVSFADASGADIADVREFVPFDSDEEDDTWEEEEEKLRRSYQEPVYRVWPEFPVHTADELIHSVRANKVEVESVTAVPEDHLSFDVLICVLNVSYHKSVFVRSTMDGWITHTESPAEYVQDSNDGDTDRFSARLSFSQPYLFNGARIDLVVRYETSDGEFWANNSRRNYSVTLLVSYEDESQVKDVVEDREIRGILKPPRHRMEYINDLSQDQDEDDSESEERPAGVAVSSCVCPLVIEPEIDIELIEASARS
ncbi:protein phosphatase 1 regulatory subunit 3A [Trichomycterus rosablanca]|uniref:protein phosphatase 1 regulatory subunit 3A n=1 Tax=Trichomycterus rosablanca TaxID=2290929 RepID=UPI002F35496C